jgi:anti-sigma regulatory factor (Ser/Thr protein kinase)
MNEWPLSSSLELAALPTAVPCARLHAKHLLWEWGLEKFSDDLELVVSELATNALQASVAMEENGKSGRSAGVPCIELRLFSDEQQVLIEVWDGNPQPPEPQGPGAHAIPALGEESGRGLFLVESLSERWGYYPTPSAEPEAMTVKRQRESTSTVAMEPTRRRAVGKMVWAIVACA